jgi:hypothetical protein
MKFIDQNFRTVSNMAEVDYDSVSNQNCSEWTMKVEKLVSNGALKYFLCT